MRPPHILRRTLTLNINPMVQLLWYISYILLTKKLVVIKLLKYVKV
jgi:hypothetical protein